MDNWGFLENNESFLYANDMGEDTDGAFMLDTTVFDSEFRQKVAQHINTCTDGDRVMGSYLMS